MNINNATNDPRTIVGPYSKYPGITEQIACKVLDTVDAGLVPGLGKPVKGQMCVEAAVNFALGLPHGDEPPCVSPILRTFKIRLNDAMWSSPRARAAGLRRLAIAQLGSEHLDPIVLAKALAELATEWAKNVAIYADNDAADAVTDAAGAVRAANVAAGNVAASYAARAANVAAVHTARAAVLAAYAAAIHAPYTAAARDQFLACAAEQVVALLIRLEAPGTRWLYLTEPTT